MEIIQFENFIKKIDWWYLKQYFTGRISLFRYYQNIFIKKFGAECQGKVLEIGADQSWSYNNYFPKANEYLHTNIIGDFDLIVDATNMFSIPDSSVDVIVCISVLEHIFEHEKAINEIERVLKPGGKLILTIPFGFPYHDEVDYWRFSKDYFTIAMEKFILHTVTNMGGRLSTIVNTLQRPCGRLTLRYFLYKLLGFLIAIIAVKLDVKDSFPLGYGIFAEKK